MHCPDIVTLDLRKIAGKGITMGSDFRVPALADADRCFGPASVVRPLCFCPSIDIYGRFHVSASACPGKPHSIVLVHAVIYLAVMLSLHSMSLSGYICSPGAAENSVVSGRAMPRAMPTRRSPLWSACMPRCLPAMKSPAALLFWIRCTSGQRCDAPRFKAMLLPCEG